LLTDALLAFPLQNKPIDYNEAAQKGKKVAKGLVSGRIQGQYKEEALNQFEGLAEYFEDKLGDDDEAKDKIFEKLKKVITSVQSNPDYSKSIDTIITLVKKYGAKADAAIDEATEKVKDEADVSGFPCFSFPQTHSTQRLNFFPTCFSSLAANPSSGGSSAVQVSH
jgi:hypothetical protein